MNSSCQTDASKLADTSASATHDNRVCIIGCGRVGMASAYALISPCGHVAAHGARPHSPKDPTQFFAEGHRRAEKASGARHDGRSKLQARLDIVRPGATLVVTRIDRLARSIWDVQDTVDKLKQKRLALHATGGPPSQFIRWT